MKDYYYILGLEKLATDSEIEKAYQNKIKLIEAKFTLNEIHDNEMLKEIQEAYECLNDKQLRQEYDNAFKHSLNVNSDLEDFNSSANQKNNNLSKIEKRRTSIMIGLLLFLGFFGTQLIIESSYVSFLKGMSLPLSFLAAASLTIFMIPFIIANHRKHNKKWIILAGNLTLGWTGLGWIALLFYAIFGKSK